MTRVVRKKDFRLGCLHGKLKAEDRRSEAHIQRTVFLSQRIKVWRKKDFAPIIRLFAYEMPLEKYMRGRCIDLMGYDDNHNLYIIELKKKESGEKIERIIKQINDYAETVKIIQAYIEQEFEKAFFFPIKFVSIKKMILASREFYAGKKFALNDNTIDYCYFRVKDINSIEPKEFVSIHLYKG
jgi:hypothetical protein